MLPLVHVIGMGTQQLGQPRTRVRAEAVRGETLVNAWLR